MTYLSSLDVFVALKANDPWIRDVDHGGCR